MRILEMNQEAVEKAIRNVESLDYKTISIKEIENILEPMFKGYEICAPKFKPGLEVYRGRICDKPTNIKEISYPPPTFIRNYGRINDKGESIFYAATGRGVTFFELKARVGDTIAISHWRTKKEAILNHIGFTSKAKKVLNSNRNLDKIYNFVRETIKVPCDINSLVNDYISSKFIESVNPSEEERYKLSIALARKLITCDLLDGLLYPTIAMFGNADNIAFKTKFVDSSIDFVSVEFVRVTNVEGVNYTFDILDSANKLDSAGNFVWSGRGLSWVMNGENKILRMSVENDTWKASNEKGETIDPNNNEILKPKDKDTVRLITKMQADYSSYAIANSDWAFEIISKDVGKFKKEVTSHSLMNFRQKEFHVAFVILNLDEEYKLLPNLVNEHIKKVQNVAFLSLVNEKDGTNISNQDLNFSKKVFIYTNKLEIPLSKLIEFFEEHDLQLEVKGLN